jgi:hypothetical protein
MKKVIRLTESELTNLIHRIIVETEMDMDRDMMKDGEMEEGFFGPSRKEKEESKKDLMNKMEDLLGNSEYTEDELANSMESILNKAKDSHYKGKVKLTKTSKGKPMFAFEPELTKMQKLAAGSRGQAYGR